ncbi:bifunctional 2',3'-cyclic-nucleotide 2'-phosphodiesterase/3'-nucleotidase [Streptococcus tangpeifui]|uniref:bifunctional 2',3'-cyclic-nucleotide 2'-phosphodiesterase/3'-nucleotidase n=1 Tax=Streptococcus tangpeifui TaxID=2709400 RepID=UPI0013EB4159|nr:bifunctional 2',3'-cyclic-nucleotide 2'-phosphodiesterase/3'-nucleotidase [Streptococcus sp. ZJ373]
MPQHYLRKSALLLSLVTAGLVANRVTADEQLPQSQSQTQNQVASASGVSSQQVATSQDQSQSYANAQAPAGQVSNSQEQPINQNPTPQTADQEKADDTKPIEGEKVDVQILSTTDLHTNLVNYDYYQDKNAQNIGLAKTALLIDQAEKENPNSVLVDNGDTIQGTPLGTYEALINPVKQGQQHPMYKAFTTLHYDAASLGNHEFNYGLDYLNRVVDSAGLPIVNANVIDARTGKHYFNPYIIIPKTFTDINGRQVTINVGITGIVPPQIMNWDKANLEGKVKTIDAVQAVEAVAPEMRAKGADIVLVMSHSGIGNDHYDIGEENVGYQIASAKGIDAVVTGHAHAEFPSGNGTGVYEKIPGVDGFNGKINGIPVTMGGKYGDHLGVIKLNLLFQGGKWKVEQSHAEIRKIDSNSDQADERILNLAKPDHEATIDYVREQVGTTTAPINSYFALVADDPSVQIVNNAQRWYLKEQLAGTPEASLPLLSAAAPFKAGARNDASSYTDIPAGPIAIKNVADLYLYDNVTAVLKVTGKDLREWLEMSAGQFNQIDPSKTGPQQLINTDYRTYNFDVIDGINYTFDVTQPNKYDIDGNLVNPDAHRVRDLTYMGQPVADNQEFMVATNNYRASGNFPGVRNASENRLLNLENRQILINYITAEKIINPTADNNWRFADTIKGLDVHFRTAERAKNLLNQKTTIQFVAADPSQNGFGDFKYIYTEATDPSRPTTPADPQAKEQEQTAKPALSLQKRQAILQMVTSNYQNLQSQTAAPTGSKTSKQAELPKTNGQSSWSLSLVGLLISIFAANLLPKSKRH